MTEELERSLNVVHRLDSLVRILILAEADESETARAASIAIFDDNLGDVRHSFPHRRPLPGYLDGGIRLLRPVQILQISREEHCHQCATRGHYAPFSNYPGTQLSDVPDKELRHP